MHHASDNTYNMINIADVSRPGQFAAHVINIYNKITEKHHIHNSIGQDSYKMLLIVQAIIVIVFFA